MNIAAKMKKLIFIFNSDGLKPSFKEATFSFIFGIEISGITIAYEAGEVKNSPIESLL